MSGLIDLHMHSSASDGILSPPRLAEECFNLGVEYAALTDHDTADGQDGFLSAAKDRGINAVTGIELNVEHRCELHILGYGYDLLYPPLKEALSHLRQERAARAGRIVSTLQKNGYLISLKRVLEIAGGGVVGRPHIARALVEKGYCKNISQAFKEFLCEGGPGYAKRERLSPADAIRLINDAGGKAVLAHPGCMENEDYPALLARLKAYGLYGIESFYPEHTDEQCEYFLRLSMDFGLLPTCGTDYHGNRYNEKFPGGEKRGINFVLSTAKNLMRNS